ncbi:MAG: hypothetical protein CMI73_03480 [Candidatus Pelagibacter sp.]|nr:hypothetical protein [Candidatus Pelagibacter sp.]OUV87187.1 MAG: hypothetical protein CBC96_03240 [Pelagibacteraceae bacterium TMED136]|tara:strand:+ start:404 stop:643 length:240 start_codon:yes stop_codon:yes gene_type:complete
MLELYKTFYQPIWTLALFAALYFPIKKILYQLYMKKYFKDNTDKNDLDNEIETKLNKRAKFTSILLSFVFSYLYVQNVF